MEDGSTARAKVAVIALLGGTEVAPPSGEVADTVSGVVSVSL